MFDSLLYWPIAFLPVAIIFLSAFVVSSRRVKKEEKAIKMSDLKRSYETYTSNQRMEEMRQEAACKDWVTYREYEFKIVAEIVEYNDKTSTTFNVVDHHGGLIDSAKSFEELTDIISRVVGVPGIDLSDVRFNFHSCTLENIANQCKECEKSFLQDWATVNENRKNFDRGIESFMYEILQVKNDRNRENNLYKIAQKYLQQTDKIKPLVQEVLICRHWDAHIDDLYKLIKRHLVE